MPSDRGFIFGGIDSIVDRGPWHYGVDYLAVYFKSNPKVLQRLLPNFFKVGDGVCVAYVSEFVSVSESNLHAPFSEPEKTLYKEAAIGVGCTWKGRRGVYFPIMWVDQVWSLARGWLNGYAKRLAERIVMTKLHPLNPRLKPLSRGTNLAGYCVNDGIKVLQVKVRVDGKGDAHDLVKFGATFGVRRFPRTHNSQLGAEEPVEVIRYNSSNSDIWVGKGEFEAAGLEASSVTLKGLHYKSGFSIGGAKVLKS